MADHDKKEIDEITGTETTQHEWDGIKELNTPLPKWWLWTFYATVVWGLAYTIFYPAWPMITTATAGVLGHTKRAAVHEAIAEHKAAQSVYTDRIAELSLDEISHDAELMQFANAGGAAIFKAYCSQCHGAGAAGVQAAGYPNLLDDDWIWGGTRDEIYQTITYGIRWNPDENYDTRLGEMPAFGEDWLTDEEIAAVVQYTRALSGLDETNAQGAEIFANECSSCHGENGEGLTMMGAPNLTDAIWLYGGDEATVTETIALGRAGVMPAWIEDIRGTSGLTDTEIKQVSLYVHSLGGGVETPAEE
ncbi:MAG: cytochrome-c oxidase, cbb3-type subunit III [Pikeienuella sp.]